MILPVTAFRSGSAQTHVNTEGETRNPVEGRLGWAHRPPWETVRFYDEGPAWVRLATAPPYKGDAVRY